MVHVYAIDKHTGAMHAKGAYKAAGDYTVSRYDIGTAALDLPLTHQAVQQTAVGDLLLIDGAYWYIVTGRDVSRDASGRVTMRAHQLAEILRRRQITPDNSAGKDMPIGYDSVAGTTETVVKHYVAACAVSPINPARIIRGLTIADDQGRGIADDAYSARYVNLWDTIASIGKLASLSPVVTADIDRQRLVFDVAANRNRTVDQQVYKPLILQMERHNLLSCDYTYDTSAAANVFYASRAGDQYAWETLTQTYWSTEDEPKGLDRRECWLSVSVYTDTGNQYEQLGKNARKAMTDYKTAESLTAAISPSMTFGRDYQVGDVATVIDKMAGVRMDAEITTVTVQDDTSGKRTATATFGDGKTSRFDKIARELKSKG